MEKSPMECKNFVSKFIYLWIQFSLTFWSYPCVCDTQIYHFLLCNDSPIDVSVSFLEHFQAVATYLSNNLIYIQMLQKHKWSSTTWLIKYKMFFSYSKI